MVDTADYEIRATVLVKLVERQFDTIHRRTAARPNLHIFAHIMTALQSQRSGSREGTGESGAGTFGSHNEYVAPVFQKAHEGLDTIGMIAIIIEINTKGLLFSIKISFFLVQKYEKTFKETYFSHIFCIFAEKFCAQKPF